MQLSAGLKDGFLQYAVHFEDDSSQMVRSKTPLDLNTRYSTWFNLSSTSAMLVINDDPVIVANDKLARVDGSQSPLLIGGHPDDIASVTNNQYKQGFRGCLIFFGVMHYCNDESNRPSNCGGRANYLLSEGQWFEKMVNIKCSQTCGL